MQLFGKCLLSTGLKKDNKQHLCIIVLILSWLPYTLWIIVWKKYTF